MSNLLKDLMTQLEAAMQAHNPTVPSAQAAINSAQTDLLGALKTQVETLLTNTAGSLVAGVATSKPVIEAALATLGPEIITVLEEIDTGLQKADAALQTLIAKLKAATSPPVTASASTEPPAATGA